MLPSPQNNSTSTDSLLVTMLINSSPKPLCKTKTFSISPNKQKQTLKFSLTQIPRRNMPLWWRSRTLGLLPYFGITSPRRGRIARGRPIIRGDGKDRINQEDGRRVAPVVVTSSLVDEMDQRTRSGTTRLGQATDWTLHNGIHSIRLTTTFCIE